MSLDAEAIDKILQLAPPQQFEIFGRMYTSKSLSPVKEPQVSPLEVHTLSGLVDLLNEKAVNFLHAGNTYMVHVNDHTFCTVLGRCTNQWCDRECWVEANLMKSEKFPFGSFLTPDTFIIQFQSLFVPSEEAQAILRIVSNLAAEAVAISQDDGISQAATVQTSVASKGSVELKPRWTLAPFRTFLEIDQPSSEFLFRLENTNGKPRCALFEADGGRWKLDAVLAIKAWLELNLDAEKFPVIA